MSDIQLRLLEREGNLNRYHLTRVGLVAITPWDGGGFHEKYGLFDGYGNNNGIGYGDGLADGYGSSYGEGYGVGITHGRGGIGKGHALGSGR